MFFSEWRRIRRNIRRLECLDEAELMALLLRDNSGIDREDADTIVKMMFTSFANHRQRKVLLRKLAKDLSLTCSYE